MEINWTDSNREFEETRYGIMMDSNSGTEPVYEDMICPECGKWESEHELSPEIEELLDDIDSGKVEMRSMTAEEYLQELQEIIDEESVPYP